MQKLIVAALAVVAILSTTVAGVYAAAQEGTTTDVGPYEGTFYGAAYGDGDSRAPMLLSLTHRGDQVQGAVYLGEGLHVDGGVCGTADVPFTAQWVEGQTLRSDPKRLVVTPTFDVGGFELSVDFESTVSADGEEIAAKARVDLPWFCGRDPVLTATLERY